MLEVSALSVSYGKPSQQTAAIGELDFTVPDCEFTCVVGPSGCGKTSLLRCLSGLMPPTAGQVVLDGQPVDEPPASLAFVFQDYSRSLLPWMTVEQNVGFPLRYQGHDKAARKAAAATALHSVGLDAVAGKHPWQLSGGMQQRVAIARALAYQPRVLLMDEPFASVDAQTRADLEDLALRIWQEFGMTVLLVTHDIDEAIYLADRVIVLSRAPSTVVRDFRADLPRPRNQIDTKNEPAFAQLRTDILRLIHRGGQAQVPTVTAPRVPGGDT